MSETKLPFAIRITPDGTDIKSLLPSFSQDTLRSLYKGHLIPKQVFQEECERRIMRNRIVAMELNDKLARAKARQQQQQEVGK